MPNRVQAERANTKRQEAAIIGQRDTRRLHSGMNKSENSKEKRAHKQPDLATGRRDGDPSGSTSRSLTSTSGSKRHASAGAGPSERTTTTAKREGKRATVTREGSSAPRGADKVSRSRRNDSSTKIDAKPIRGKQTKSKSTP